MDVRTLALVGAFVAGATSGTLAQSAPFFIVGGGSSSCGTWLQNAEYQAAGDSWILGFWTGADAMAPDHLTGKSTDTQGILGEVKKECLDQPSEMLVGAIMKVRETFEAEGR